MGITTSVNEPYDYSTSRMADQQTTQKTSNDPNNTGTGGNSAVDLQDSFLTLLIAQLKNQDPTNPLSNNELITQLAQINTVSGIEKLNTTMGGISGQIDSGQSMQASNLIGHGVMIPGNSVLLGTGEGTEEEPGKVTTTPFGIELGRPADKVTVTITDTNGKVIRTIEMGGLKAGVHCFNWDGSMDDGSTAPDGAYKVAINASYNGEQMVANPLTFGVVHGVIRSANGPILDLGVQGNATLDDVRQIM